MSAAALLSPLVSTQWLADHLGVDGLIVLDATVLGVPRDGRLTWLSGLDQHLVEGHVPGAQFADLLEEFADPAGAFGFTRPDAVRFARAAAELGIGDESTIVVYDRALGQWAARLWWLFRAFGVERVAVLDGGYAAWVREQRPIEHGHTPAPEAGPLTLVPRPERWAELDEVEAVVAGERDARLVCALPRSDFAGETGGRPRLGHIPGSVSVPVGSVVDRDAGGFRRGESLDRALEPATAGTPGRVIVYCGSGITAAGTALALVLAGHDDVAVYDGSLNEWVADESRPLARLAG